MTESNESDGRLASWKEIAAFLGVDERTCQRWEKKYGLPVRRLEESAKSRVFARRSELERWRESAFKNGASLRESPELSAALQAKPKAEPGSERRRKIGPIPVLATIALLGGLAAIALLALFKDRQPADFRIEGSFLLGTNKRGRELWRFDTKRTDLAPESMVRLGFQTAQPVLSSRGIDARAQVSLIMKDFDGDGWNETLYSPSTKEDGDIGRLFLLDRRGEEIWHYDLGHPVRVGGRAYPLEAVIGGLFGEDLNGDGAVEFLAVSHVRMESPTHVVVLNLKGTALGEYSHFGQISDIQLRDLDGDKLPEVICCGQTRGDVEGPCYFVLDPRNLRGAAPALGPASTFEGMAVGSELLYVTFPLTPLEAKESPGVSAIRLVILDSGRVEVRIDADDAVYGFDFRGRLQNVTLGDELERRYKTAVASGQLPCMPDFSRLQIDLAAGIRYYDGPSKHWTNAWARSNPR